MIWTHSPPPSLSRLLCPFVCWLRQCFLDTANCKNKILLLMFSHCNQSLVSLFSLIASPEEARVQSNAQN